MKCTQCNNKIHELDKKKTTQNFADITPKIYPNLTDSALHGFCPGCSEQARLHRIENQCDHCHTISKGSPQNHLLRNQARFQDQSKHFLHCPPRSTWSDSEEATCCLSMEKKFTSTQGRTHANTTTRHVTIIIIAIAIYPVLLCCHGN